MKIWKDLIVENEFHRTGTGYILSVDLQKSGVVDAYWIDEIPIETNDIIVYMGMEFRIRKIECFGNLLSDKIRANVGLVVVGLGIHEVK